MSTRNWLDELCGYLLLALGLLVILLGWQEYNGEGARLARYMAARLGMDRPLWQEPGVVKIVLGLSGQALGAIILAKRG